MNDFAHLLDRLAYEPRRNAKLRLLQDFFARTPDPERGYALGAMTGTLSFREAKPALIRGLVEDRIDPVLFRLSYNYVGDLAETAALIWPAPPSPSPSEGLQIQTTPDRCETRSVFPGLAEGENPESIAAALAGRDEGDPRRSAPAAAMDSGLRSAAPERRGLACRSVNAPASAGEGGPRVSEGRERGAPHPAPSLPSPDPLRGPPYPQSKSGSPDFDTKGPDLGQARDLEGGGDAHGGLGHNNPPPHVPSLAEVVETLATIPKKDLPGHLAHWLDALDETGRWALLKLVTGNLRVGVSARLAKTAVGVLGGYGADAVEEVWHGLSPPFVSLFAWVEGRAARPETLNPAPFRPPMLSHPIEEAEDLEKLAPNDFSAEWKWDGIRVQLVGGRDRDGTQIGKVYSRTGEDITHAFPDLAEAITFAGAIDGELLILRAGRVQSFNVLQQRLNRKTVTDKLLEDFPAHVRAYDLLARDGADLRSEPFSVRRKALEDILEHLEHARIDLSPIVPFADWEALAAARADPASVGAGADADAIEGVMLKRLDSPYLPGRPKGPWWKWKRAPHVVDAVMMYAQRGHGKRSSFYSDYTFGVWREAEGGDELVPVGKAYHGFTDAELQKLDRYVRNNTTKRFGPVREVSYGLEAGLVLEIAFEGVQRSTRHKSGVAMRFPRISRIRWDKPPAEADRIDALERILARGEREIAPGAAPKEDA